MESIDELRYPIGKPDFKGIATEAEPLRSTRTYTSTRGTEAATSRTSRHFAGLWAGRDGWYAGPRSTFPGSAPVRRPLSSTIAPFTIT